MDILWLAYIILAALCVAVLFSCYVFVKYYTERNAGEMLPTVITVLGLSVVLMAVFLIPVDIYVVSSSQNSDGERVISDEDLDFRTNVVRILYYTFYSMILSFAFGLIPFAYFYYEEDDLDATVSERIWGGCKYTIFVILIVVILLVVGLCLYLFNTPAKSDIENGHVKDWVDDMMKHKNPLDAAISFSVASVTAIGYLCWITYTAYGLSALPIGTVRGKMHLKEELSSTNSKIEDIKEKKAKTLQKQNTSRWRKNKGGRNSETLPMLKYEREEKIQRRRLQRLEAQQTGWRKIIFMIKPFLFLFGFVFSIITLLIVISMLLTSIDKAAQSGECGAKCGFVLTYPKIFNPLDTMLTRSSAYFPVDYVIMIAVVSYIFMATMSGITKIGIRLCCFNLFDVRKGGTPPQGLLLATIILMFSVLVLNMEITTLAPQYATWGTQQYKYCPNATDMPSNNTMALFANSTDGIIEPCEIKACSYEAPKNSTCIPTQVGDFVNKIRIQTNFFGVIYFACTWLFFLTFLVGALVAACRSKSSNTSYHDSDSESDED